MLRQSLLVRTHSTIERIHAVRICTITMIHSMERTFQMMYFTRDNSICSGAAPHSLPAAGLRLGRGTCTYHKFNVENGLVSNVLITYNVEYFNNI